MMRTKTKTEGNDRDVSYTLCNGCLAAKQTKNQSSGAIGPHSVEYTTAFLNTRTLQNVLSINYI